MPAPRRTLRDILGGFHRAFKILGKLFDADSWISAVALGGPAVSATLPCLQLRRALAAVATHTLT